MMLACSSKSKPNETAPEGAIDAQTVAPAPEPSLRIFFTSEIKGSTEPCGCTADPLGDLARTTELIAEARKRGPVLVFDGGSTLYTALELTEMTRSQEALKAQLLARAFQDYIDVSAMALGPFDLSEGTSKAVPARQVANILDVKGLRREAPKVVEAGGIKVGVFGVVDPELVAPFGISASDPVEAAREAIASLQEQGAQVVVGLAHMEMLKARGFAREAKGIDFLLVGADLPQPTDPDYRESASQTGSTWLFQPADRGQIVSRVDIYPDNDGIAEAEVFSDAIGAERSASRIAELAQEAAELSKNISEWEKDPTSNAAFVQQKREELNELAAEQRALERQPLQAPSSGPFFTFSQVRIAKALACNTDVVADKQEFDRQSGAANVAAAKGTKPPKPAKGQASYVGSEECEMCHDDQATFWKGTHHAGAWETLEKLGKQFNYDCIGCHVTGFEKPGGSNLAYNDALRDVQCEQCHGPGSLHVDADGPDKKKTISRQVSEEVCLQCHTPDHSDTFNFDAYLRDITGKGHGETLRKQLGDGPTGFELRKAALEKAGKAIGDGCPK